MSLDIAGHPRPEGPETGFLSGGMIERQAHLHLVDDRLYPMFEFRLGALPRTESFAKETGCVFTIFQGLGCQIILVPKISAAAK